MSAPFWTRLSRVVALRAALATLFGYHVLRAIPQVDVATRFHLPVLPETLVAPPPVAIALLVLRGLLAVAMFFGVRAVETTALSSLLLLHQLLSDRLDYHNNRYALALYGIAALPALWVHSASIKQGPVRSRTPANSLAEASRETAGPQRQDPTEALLPVRLQCALIYLASGGSKLVDGDWRGGVVLAQRIATFGGEAVRRGVPRGLVAFLGEPSVASLLAKGAIAIELSLALLVFVPFRGKPVWRHLRTSALLVGLLFHLTIEATAKVEGFSLLTLAAYLAFLPARCGSGPGVSRDASAQKRS
jgi:hypothetical protein